MNKKTGVRIIVLFAGFGLFVLTLNAFWLYNAPLQINPDGESEAIRLKVVDSASLLLQSTSEAYLFMNEVELAEVRGLDFDAAQHRIQLAMGKLVQAREAMERVIQLTLAGGVPGERRRTLSGFDYANMADQYSLNGEIMGKVTSFLIRGDVVGLYRQHVDNLRTIETLLLYLDGEIGQGRRPENDRMWPVLRLYNETLLLANYATMVFYQA